MYLSKMHVLFVGISLEKLWETLEAKAGLASLKSLQWSRSSQSTPRSVFPSHQILATVPLIVSFWSYFI